MKIALLNILICLLVSCGTTTNNKQNNTKQPLQIAFSADSAYHFVEKQVNFGYRIPNTAEHKACADYLAETLERFGAKVIRQHADLTAYDGTVLHSQNIIGSYHTDLKERVLLCAHWDTRPWSDHDPNPNNHRKPLLGANDAASGVGVLLEIARQMHTLQPTVGIDIIFFDSEDYGTPEFHRGAQEEHTWCLGSQYWAKKPHTPNYTAQYGILLDMVGAPNALFAKEYFSMQYAGQITNTIWEKAHALGFGHLFINQSGGAITDDHYYVNTLAKIPCTNIIHYNPHSKTGFADYWHTQNDDMSNVSKHTLYAVGRTVLEVIYN